MIVCTRVGGRFIGSLVWIDRGGLERVEPDYSLHYSILRLGD